MVLTGAESPVDAEQENAVEQLAVPSPTGLVEAAQPMAVFAYPAEGQVTHRPAVRVQAVHERVNSFQAS